MFDTVEVGKRIKKRRNDLHMSAAELAEKTGYTQNHIYAIEKGKEGMSWEAFCSISHALNISMEYLAYGADIYEKESVEELTARVSSILDLIVKKTKETK